MSTWRSRSTPQGARDVVVNGRTIRTYSPTKVCTRCGVEKPNDHLHYNYTCHRFRDLFTTIGVCKDCEDFAKRRKVLIGWAVSKGELSSSARDMVTPEAVEEVAQWARERLKAEHVAMAERERRGVVLRAPRTEHRTTLEQCKDAASKNLQRRIAILEQLAAGGSENLQPKIPEREPVIRVIKHLTPEDEQRVLALQNELVALRARRSRGQVLRAGAIEEVQQELDEIRQRTISSGREWEHWKYE